MEYFTVLKKKETKGGERRSAPAKPGNTAAASCSPLGEGGPPDTPQPPRPPQEGPSEQRPGRGGSSLAPGSWQVPARTGSHGGEAQGEWNGRGVSRRGGQRARRDSGGAAVEAACCDVPWSQQDRALSPEPQNHLGSHSHAENENPCSRGFLKGLWSSPKGLWSEKTASTVARALGDAGSKQPRPAPRGQTAGNRRETAEPELGPGRR